MFFPLQETIFEAYTKRARLLFYIASALVTWKLDKMITVSEQNNKHLQNCFMEEYWQYRYFLLYTQSWPMKCVN